MSMNVAVQAMVLFGSKPSLGKALGLDSTHSSCQGGAFLMERVVKSGDDDLWMGEGVHVLINVLASARQHQTYR
jgi:hypothetical protein